jgi:Mrp family chromosome partitioning ATPase
LAEGGGTANPTGDSVEGNIPVKDKKNTIPVNWMKDPVGKRPPNAETSILIGGIAAASYVVAGALGFKGASALASHAAASLTEAQKEVLLDLSRKSGNFIVAASGLAKAP